MISRRAQRTITNSILFIVIFSLIMKFVAFVAVIAAFVLTFRVIKAIN